VKNDLPSLHRRLPPVATLSGVPAGAGRFYARPDSAEQMNAAAVSDVSVTPGHKWPMAGLAVLGAAGSAVLGVPPAAALVAGAVLALLLGNPLAPTTGRVAQLILKIAVVGLGAGIHLDVVLAVGARSFGSTALTILLTLGAGLWLAARMGLRRDLSVLISAGTAICGGSAIAAVAGVINPKSDDTAIALSVVFLLNAVALIIFPPLGAMLGFSQHQFGIWSALAIHDTSSVVGAALTYGREAAEIATTTKLVRALWIAPVAMVIAWWWNRGKETERKGSRFPVPGFILGFLAVAALFSYCEPLAPWRSGISDLARRLFASTLFLVGLGFSRQALRHAGLRPVVFAVCLWLGVMVATAGAISAGWLQ
jgi:uncharacterized integral membrane protein (TIGR00698 family)